MVNKMIHNVVHAFIQYWYLSLALVLACILTAFVCNKANKAAKKSRQERDKIIEGLKYENRLRAEFSELTGELIEKSEPKRLFDGIAVIIQTRLEKETDMESAFNNLPQPQKFIYALYYVEHDGTEKLSEFFKMNGKPLTPVAGEAVITILGCKASELYNKEFGAFDKDNEEVSLIKSEITACDEEFRQLLTEIDMAALAADYIRKNTEAFLSQS